MSSQRKNSGFSLIELMIVVAIIGILSAIAYPSYTNYVVRANRAEAMETLTEIMNQQQRYVLRQRQYAADLSLLGYNLVDGNVVTERGLYNITAAACGGSTIARCVMLTAQPVAGSRQAGDGNLTLNSQGLKTWGAEAGWHHRE